MKNITGPKALWIINDALLIDEGCFTDRTEDFLEKNISEFDEPPEDDE